MVTNSATRRAKSARFRPLSFRSSVVMLSSIESTVASRRSACGFAAQGQWANISVRSGMRKVLPRSSSAKASASFWGFLLASTSGDGDEAPGLFLAVLGRMKWARASNPSVRAREAKTAVSMMGDGVPLAHELSEMANRGNAAYLQLPSVNTRQAFYTNLGLYTCRSLAPMVS